MPRLPPRLSLTLMPPSDFASLSFLLHFCSLVLPSTPALFSSSSVPPLFSPSSLPPLPLLSPSSLPTHLLSPSSPPPPILTSIPQWQQQLGSTREWAARSVEDNCLFHYRRVRRVALPPSTHSPVSKQGGSLDPPSLPRTLLVLPPVAA
ncbi:unnamed protein product [Closterium sp. Naga37s-1]|nr:unnamed protein product [Closterium sp. Naga37s-1]